MYSQQYTLEKKLGKYASRKVTPEFRKQTEEGKVME